VEFSFYGVNNGLFDGLKDGFIVNDNN